METIIKLLVVSVMVVLLGTFLMYGVESNEPNSEIKSLEDALWWWWLLLLLSDMVI